MDGVRRLAEQQGGRIARRQLEGLGWSSGQVDGAIRRGLLVPEHDGVFALGHRSETPDGRFWAAVLTAPDSVLSHASVGALLGFRPWRGPFEVVTRPGSGGPRRFGGVLVCRSTTLEGDVVTRRGLPTTSGARALLDLAPSLPPWELDRCVREALRLRATSAEDLLATLDRHRGRRGTTALRALVDRYRPLRVERFRSDPELAAFEALHEAGRPLPYVNRRFAGEEADLAWPAHRLIVEVDGPEWHLFAEEDARKQAKWEEAGWTVERIPSDRAYDPTAVLELAPPV